MYHPNIWADQTYKFINKVHVYLCSMLPDHSYNFAIEAASQKHHHGSSQEDIPNMLRLSLTMTISSHIFSLGSVCALQDRHMPTGCTIT
jgi:hypothetical protein